MKKLRSMLYLLITFCFIGLTTTLDVSSIVFVILSQNDKVHAQRAEILKEDLINQMKTHYHARPEIHLCHEEFNSISSWTILPLLPILDKLHSDTAKWIIFLEDYTAVDTRKLVMALEKYNHKQETWIGHSVHDNEATIIHHFAFHENPKSFKYPVIASGVAMSIPLIQRLMNKLKHEKLNSFTIDVAHELALFIGGEVPLKDEPTFCVQKNILCATFATEYQCCGGGYSYLTGGAGIVFSIPALKILTERCTCPSIDSPDDMIFGACLVKEGIDMVHSPAFHQARPMDYTSDYLAVPKPLSFHKHWNADPLQIYNTWFQKDDVSFSKMEIHDEL
ncbi:unnamed protein product [Acanthoscelides obtectus]|uniref:Fringe-like glycosyltransferase domain-containing protein n=1 Tax=Acanthoscelides obtectus TaxID=200917 RepID=A0A9P0NVA0_ACAOB|nr:unnamed protein product [Acanthoscelides obtectus]CAK1621247.1 Beta-1,3-glucosyltransferase [Acanthoscelides obtectus]